jgi:hypothetical protein
MIVHMYIAKKWARGYNSDNGWQPRRDAEVKLLCLDSFVAFDEKIHKSVERRVTCRQCLELIVPKKEAELDSLRDRLTTARRDPNQVPVSLVINDGTTNGS